jgi:hypothetical protein
MSKDYLGNLLLAYPQKKYPKFLTYLKELTFPPPEFLISNQPARRQRN